MKKTILLTVALALLFLAGCGRSGTEEERGIDTKRSFFHQLQSTRAAETKDTIYFIGRYEQHIKYVDKETGISGPLCGKPECDHDGKECNAWVYAGVECLFVNDSRLYWIGHHYPYSIQQPFSLFSTALDGTDRREVRLPYELDFNGTIINPLLYVENEHLYVSVAQESIEDGSEVLYQKIEALDLEGDMGTTTVLDERVEIDSDGVPMQFYDGWLYFMTCEGPWGQPGEHHFRLRRWNEETGETETLYDEPNSRRLSSIKDMWVDDRGVLFMAYNYETKKMGMYRYDFADGGVALVCDTGVTGTVSGGIADGIVSGFTLEESGEAYDFHVVIRDFEGQTLLDETCRLDLAKIERELMDDIYGAGSWTEEDFSWDSGYMLGRDETYAYYTLDADYNPNGVEYSFTTIIQVPLDGSGAKVLCTEQEKL